MSDLVTAIAKLASYLPNTTGAKRETYLRRIAEYALREAGEDGTSTVAEATPDADWSGTYTEAYDRWLDAADEVLKAAGKPYGREGAERGSMDRAESIALAKKIGVFDELGGDDGIWGPDLGPDVKQ